MRFVLGQNVCRAEQRYLCKKVTENEHCEKEDHPQEQDGQHERKANVLKGTRYRCAVIPEGVEGHFGQISGWLAKGSLN